MVSMKFAALGAFAAMDMIHHGNATATSDTCHSSADRSYRTASMMQLRRTAPTCDWETLPFNAPWTTNCPSTPWIDEMVKADPSPDKIIMDVGCNKGDDAIEWMDRWDPSGSFWNKSTWIATLRDHHPRAGPCGPPSTGFQKASTLGEHVSAQSSPTTVCVEPMKSNVELLRSVQRSLGYDAAGQNGVFHVVQAALSDKAGDHERVDFPDLPAGGETGKLNLMQSPVRLSTVDKVMAELKLPRLDILTIDTEGHDPAVLLGAAAAMRKIRYLEFEVHRDFTSQVWGTTTLKSVVDQLYYAGFDCYWSGNSGDLISINRCWDDSFENAHWSNAACVRQGDVWDTILRKFAAPRTSSVAP
eukprot:TRINITY_DN8884_c0_g1_i1.p1 TRINITY_DN8884_c0_g1~~TRINITY_DN8884_c0_g1_i1.p1  ORF type:complete len:358 (-),score=44.60 TRINITY_DN8884_c0_g1_i1:55-1128(-)